MAISLADHHDHRTQLESQSEATFRTVLFDSLSRSDASTIKTNHLSSAYIRTF